LLNGETISDLPTLLPQKASYYYSKKVEYKSTAIINII